MRGRKALILKAVDTLEFGLLIEDYYLSMSPHLEQFKYLKDKAQKEGKEQSIKIGEIELTVHATGQKFYAYRLSCNDFLISFMEKEMSFNSPVMVRLLSSFLWSYGVVEAQAIFMKWFSTFSVNVLATSLSRIDPSFDTDEMIFTQKDVKGVVTRAKGKTEHFVNEEYTYGRKFSGFTIGRGKPMLARIYNKTLEVKKSGKTWFHQIWRDNNWDETKDVWRVEYQIRREALKELGIATFESFIEKQNELWAYLTKEWLTLRNPSKDNISRWKLKRKWKLIQEAKNDYVAEPLIRETIKQGNLMRLLDQAAGLLMSVAAISNHESTGETTKVLQSWCDSKLAHKKKSFESEKTYRQSKFLNLN